MTAVTPTDRPKSVSSRCVIRYKAQSVVIVVLDPRYDKSYKVYYTYSHSKALTFNLNLDLENFNISHEHCIERERALIYATGSIVQVYFSMVAC